MPQSVDFEGLGIALDFPDEWSGDQINSWLSDNFDGHERDWKKQALTQDLQSFNRDSRQYGAGYRWLNAVGSLTDRILGGIGDIGQTMLRKGPEVSPVFGGPGGRGNMWVVEKALGYNPWDLMADKLRDVGHDISEVTQVIPIDEMGQVEKFWSEDVAGGIGSASTFIMGGYALRGPMTANQAAMTLGALTGYSNGYNRSIEAGDDEDTANFLGLLNAGVGLSEAFPVGKWIDRINGKTGWSLGSLLREAGEEAVQEFFQSGMEDLIASIGTEDLDLMETLRGSLYSGLVGGVTGLAMAGGTTAVARARGQETEAITPRRLSPQESAMLEGRMLPFMPPHAAPEQERREPTGEVISVDETGTATKRTRDEHNDFVASSEAAQLEAVEDLARSRGESTTEARAKFMAQQQAKITAKQQAAAAQRGPDYGSRQALLEHGVSSRIVSSDIGLEENNTVNANDLNTITKAFIGSLAPQNTDEQRILAGYVARRNRKSGQNAQMAAVEEAQQGDPVSATERRLFNQHMLRSWLRAVDRQIQIAEESGQTRVANKIRRELAEQFGLKFDKGEVAFPAHYNTEAIFSLSEDARTSAEERDQFRQSYQPGTVVQVNDLNDPDQSVVGQVVGHKINEQNKIDLLIATADGKQLRVPAENAEVVESSFLNTDERRAAVERELGMEQETTAAQPQPLQVFNLQMAEWLSQLNPVSVSYDVTQTASAQGVRTSQMSMSDFDTILGSLGVDIALSRVEANQRMREVQQATALMQKSATTIDKEVPTEQLDDWAALFKVQGWRTGAKKQQKIKTLKKAINKAMTRRKTGAQYRAYYRAALDAALSGTPVDGTVLDKVRAYDQDLGDRLESAMKEGEQARGESEIDPLVVEAFKPEFRDGKTKKVKKGDKIPVVFDGYSMVNDQGIGVALTIIGNWTLPNGRAFQGAFTSTILDPALDAYLKEQGIQLVPVKVGKAAMEGGSLEQQTKGFMEAFNKEPKILTSMDPKADLFVTNEDGIDVILEEGGSMGQKESLNEWTRRTTFVGPDPVFIKPTYSEEAGAEPGRIGFAMVGFSDRGTKPLEIDDLASKHGSAIRRAEPVTGPMRQEPGEMEMFKPGVFVVMWDEQGNPIGHLRFSEMKNAKAYLRERLHDDGVRAVRARRPVAFEEIQREPEPEAPMATMAGGPWPVIPQQLGGPFAKGTERDIPLRRVAALRSRPDAGPQEIIGRVEGFQDVVRVRSVIDGLELDVAEVELTQPVEITTREVMALARSSGFRNFSRVTKNPMGFKPGNLAELTHEQRAQMVATQVPLNIPIGQIVTMNAAELQALADREAFGDVALLGMRVGRHLRSVSHLRFLQSIRTQPGTKKDLFVGSVWASAFGSTVGANLQPAAANQFALTQSDMTYVPPVERLLGVKSEAFTRKGQPALAEQVSQEATLKTPLHVLRREGDKVIVRDTISGELKELDAADVKTQESPDVRADTGVMQFERDLRQAGENVDEVQRRLQRAPRRARRIANSHISLPVPVRAFDYYTADDFIRLAEQEGQGDMKAAAYRAGRNMQSIVEFNRMLGLRRVLMRRAEGSTVQWSEAMLTDMRRLKNVINGIGWENMTEADQASLALAGFVNPAIEAATGINPDLSHSKTVELWQDPTYVPPFQCSSPCRRNQKDQKDNNQKCPESAATPDPGVQQTPEEAARWKRNRRKRTKSVQWLLSQEEWVRRFPGSYKSLKGGTYIPRGWAELREASAMIVNQWDTGIDGLRELAQIALSNKVEDRWWNVSDDMKPAVLVEIAERLAKYSAAMKDPAAVMAIDALEENIWHNVQMLGSISGQMLNTFRYLWGTLNKKFFLERVVKRMFQKSEQMDVYEKILPQLDKLKDLINKAPEGTPKLRAIDQMSKLISKNMRFDKMDKFWALWYNNVLSSFRTQFDNASMALNVVMEAALTAVSRPGQAHLVAKALMEGFHYAGTRFGQILKGDYSGRLGDPYELQDKFAKDLDFAILRPKTIDHMAQSERMWERLLAKSTGWVTHLMSAMDNVVSQGGFELRAHTRAYQMAMDELNKKANEYAKAGKPWAYTNKDVEQLKNEILRTTPEDMRRYREQADREIQEGWINPDERDIRIKELQRLSIPQDIMDDAEHYGKWVAGTAEPIGLSGRFHRIIANNKSRPDVVGAATKAVFPFTRWAACWTNIITDYMPPVSLWRMFIYSPNKSFIEKGIGKLTSEEWIAKKREWLAAGEKKLSVEDYHQLRMRAIAGAAFSMSAWALFSRFDDEEEPYLQITGGMYNLSPQNRNQLREKGINPWSIVIGGRSFTYRNTPLAGAFGFVGNVKDSDRYGQSGEDHWKWMTAAFRGAFMVQDMSVLSGATDLLDILANNRYGTEYRIRSLAGWLGRFGQGVFPLSNLNRDVEAWVAEAFGKPVAYNPTTGWGMFFRDWPWVQRLIDGQPALNVLGEEVNVSRLPWARQIYPRRNDPMWDAVGIKANQGVFLPAIVTATKTDPITGNKERMSETEEYRYKSEVYKRMGDLMRSNYSWYRYAQPEHAQRWLDRHSSRIRAQVRYELGLQ